MRRPGIIFNNVVRKYAWTGFLFGLLFPVSATIARILSMGLAVSPSSIAAVQSGDWLLWIIDTAPIFLGLFAGFAGHRQGMLQKTNAELVHIEKELRSIQSTLERRVEQRTVELIAANQKAEKNTEQLKTIAEIARMVIKNRSIDELLPQLASLISSRFGFYHIGIFLLEDNHEYALLQAANSEGGEKMLARGHRLLVGQQGIVGYVTSQGKARIALDACFWKNGRKDSNLSTESLKADPGKAVFGDLTDGSFTGS